MASVSIRALQLSACVRAMTGTSQDSAVQNNTGKTANPDNNYYVSPLIHTVLLTDLAPDTTYYYRCKHASGFLPSLLTSPVHHLILA